MTNANTIIKILEISACCNKQAETKLFFKGDSVDRMYLFINRILQKGNYDILAIREISWHALKKVKHLLSSHGYNCYIHESWDHVKENNRTRYTCLSVAFVKECLDFSQLYTSECFDTKLRYVYGKMKFNEKYIYWKSSHIPCVDDDSNRIEAQLKRKELMLVDEVQFQKDMNNELALSSGDFNGCSGGNYCCSELYDKFSFQDLISEKTYGDKCLDHVYVSKKLMEHSNIKVNAEVLNDFYMEFTDHKLVSISIHEVSTTN